MSSLDDAIDRIVREAKPEPTPEERRRRAFAMLQQRGYATVDVVHRAITGPEPTPESPDACESPSPRVVVQSQCPGCGMMTTEPEWPNNWKMRCEHCGCECVQAEVFWPPGAHHYVKADDVVPSPPDACEPPTPTGYIEGVPYYDFIESSDSEKYADLLALLREAGLVGEPTKYN